MKRLGFVCLTLVMLLGVAACSGKAQTNNTPVTSPVSDGTGTNTSTPAKEQRDGQNSGTDKEENKGQDEGQNAGGKIEGAATAEEGAHAVVAALKDKDMEKLKTLIHPEKGLLFSPYVHIEKDSALVFKRSELPALDDEKIYTWGQYDGSGESIKMTFAQYVERFVYDHDFSSPEQIGLNEIKGSGNSLPNIQEVFPEGQFVDYYFSGFEEQYAGMDWASLIIVLEEYQGSWYAVAAVHNQWTI
ncbi:hypothetical protein ACX93W_17180 [Paenibacillus sp. CAU 1782]